MPDHRFSAEDVATALMFPSDNLIESIGGSGAWATVRAVHHFDDDESGIEVLKHIEVELQDARDDHTETFRLSIWRA